MANQAERLNKRLQSTRDFSMRLLEDFSTAEQWTWQLHEGGNHAAWFVGHMGTTRDTLSRQILALKLSVKIGAQQRAQN